MTTTYVEIYDLFLQRVKDWRLDAFFSVSEDDFNEYLQGFLVLGIARFTGYATQSLARDDDANTFDETLTDPNQEVLSTLMVEAWLERSVQDIKQFELHLADKKGFRTYSESQNLREKSAQLTKVREKVSQRMNEISWYGNDWTSWLDGDFGS